jgi:glycine cleavage system aminomethyltransferase T
MSLATEVSALRRSAGLSRADHVRIVSVDGPDALDFLQTVSTQSPYVREGRVRHALFLRDDGSIIADAFLVKVEDSFLVLAEGPAQDEVVTWLESARERSPTAKEVTFRSMREDWVALGVDGPYAWEVVAGLLGPVVLGQPYLTLFRRGDVLCLRAGKTGEYGYLLLVPSQAFADVETKLREIGGPLDLAPVSLEALDVCAFENWHFSMRTLRETSVVSPLTPLELQLQWRVVYTREFIGAAALRARRAEGARVRATCFLSDGPVRAGQRVRLAGLDIGEVLAACESPTLGQTVGSALLLLRFAHPHVTLSAVAPEGEIAFRTCTASLVDNLSLRILPHKHAYATRALTEVSLQ